MRKFLRHLLAFTDVRGGPERIREVVSLGADRVAGVQFGVDFGEPDGPRAG